MILLFLLSHFHPIPNPTYVLISAIGKTYSIKINANNRRTKSCAISLDLLLPLANSIRPRDQLSMDTILMIRTSNNERRDRFT